VGGRRRCSPTPVPPRAVAPDWERGRTWGATWAHPASGPHAQLGLRRRDRCLNIKRRIVDPRSPWSTRLLRVSLPTAHGLRGPGPGAAVCACGRLLARTGEPHPSACDRWRASLRGRCPAHDLVIISCSARRKREARPGSCLGDRDGCRGPMIEPSRRRVAAAAGAGPPRVAVNKRQPRALIRGPARGTGQSAPRRVVTHCSGLTPRAVKFVSTLNAVLHVGAPPRFRRHRSYFNLDPTSLFFTCSPPRTLSAPLHHLVLVCPPDGRHRRRLGGRDNRDHR